MQSYRKLALILAGAFLSTFPAGSTTAAAEDLTIPSDQSTPIALPRVPSVVVVGNPSIADATIDGRMLFLYGKGFGRTNVVVLGEDGAKMAEYKVRVAADDPESVVVFKQSGGQTLRHSFSCATDCQPTLQVGDSAQFVNDVSAAMSSRTNAVEDQIPDETTTVASPMVPTAP